EPPRKRLKRSRQDKLDLLFWMLKKELGWTFGEMLCNALNDPEPGDKRSETQSKMLTGWFKSEQEYPISRFLQLSLKHPFGRNPQPDLMFCVDRPYTGISGVREGLSSFSAQLIEERLLREAEEVIKPSSGLHISIGTKGKQKTQPLRKRRNIDNVACHAISMINFSRSSRANLLPLATGILHFASLVPIEICRYHCRIGLTPHYTTLIRAMERLARDSASKALSYGPDPGVLAVLRFDNVHSYLMQRDMRIGREHRLITGLYGAAYLAEWYVNIDAFRLEDKRAAIDEGKRRTVTTRKLYNLIDHDHIATVLTLEFLRALTQHIPELRHLAPAVSDLYKTKAAKIPLEPRRTTVRPLGSASKNEMYYTELRDFLLDMFEQTGQNSEKFKPLLQPVGGDGLTYEKLLDLQSMLQFEGNAFDSMERVLPMLEGFHKDLTELCNIFQTFYGTSLTTDYSTLGHSATKLGRRRPADLKKIDYYSGLQLVFLTLDCRLLDCWRLYFNEDDIFEYFKERALEKEIPSIDELHDIAKQLYHSYMSPSFSSAVMSGRGLDGGVIPVSLEPWSGEVHDDSSKDFDAINHGKTAVHTGPKKTKPRASATAQKVDALDAGSSDDPATVFLGDRALETSRLFMRSAALLRESTVAAAEGDPGRVYEITKCHLFHFAGSTHSKYTDYLLQTIISREYESSDALKLASLQISLVNLTGKPGGFAHGDLMQEHFNRLLDKVVQRKGALYGDRFIRDVWARNVHHVARLKSEWISGLGLDLRSASHHDPSVLAEIQTLLKTYKDHELHVFKPGRTFSDENRDLFQKGFDALEAGKLAKHITRSYLRHGVARRLERNEALTSVPESVNVEGTENREDA
ncbi:hypothetical protein BD626DRAFT_362119, partial [Schizophyllum amplum]